MQYRVLLVSFLLILITPFAVLADEHPPPVACEAVLDAHTWEPPIEAPAADADWDAWNEYYIKVIGEINRRGIAVMLDVQGLVVPFYNRCYLVKVGGFTVVQASVIATLLAQAELRMKEKLKRHSDPLSHP